MKRCRVSCIPTYSIPLPYLSLFKGGPIDADNVEDNYMIGLGGSKTGNTDNGPSATFVPEPNAHYQIQPANTYFLAFGDYTKGNIIDVQKIGGQVLEIDFTKFTSRDIKVSH